MRGRCDTGSESDVYECLLIGIIMEEEEAETSLAIINNDYPHITDKGSLVLLEEQPATDGDIHLQHVQEQDRVRNSSW